MVPGQVIKADTIEFMRKLDVKEIHGYDATLGLKLISPGGAGGEVARSREKRSRRSRRRRREADAAQAPTRTHLHTRHGKRSRS